MIERVIELISTIGAIGSVPPDGRFYEAGFSSIRALELLLAIEEEFQVSIPDKEFISARTPREVANLIERLQTRKAA
jgi:acyl carrier protein